MVVLEGLKYIIAPHINSTSCFKIPTSLSKCDNGPLDIQIGR